MQCVTITVIEPGCSPVGATQCDNETHTKSQCQTIDGVNQWVPIEYNSVECGYVCTDNTTKCDYETHTLYRCQNDEWVPEEYNSETCGYVEPCTVGTYRCNGFDLEQCQQIGGVNTWVVVIPGYCCNQGDPQICIDNYYYECAPSPYPDISTWIKSSEICSPIPCTDPVGQPGEKVCFEDGYYWQCDGQGNWVKTTEWCGEQPCTDPVSGEPGDFVCIDNLEYKCTDGSWLATGNECGGGGIPNMIPIVLGVAGIGLLGLVAFTGGAVTGRRRGKKGKKW
jgi:hypothetical protein